MNNASLQKEVLPDEKYLLPAGIDLDSNEVIDQYVALLLFASNKRFLPYRRRDVRCIADEDQSPFGNALVTFQNGSSPDVDE